MGGIEIRLFGGVQLSWAGRPLPAFPTQKSKSLFALLVLEHDRPHAREMLADMFWPERPSSQSRKALRNELWRVRKTLDSAGADLRNYLREDAEFVSFDLDSRCWLDVNEFETELAAVSKDDLHARSAERLAGAVSLYRGDLITGVYDDWCIYIREYYRTRFLNAMERLMDFTIENGELLLAIDHGMKLLIYDPVAEHIHRKLMLCYFASGNRPAALKQFEICARRLDLALDIEPMEETATLYHVILTGDRQPERDPNDANGGPRGPQVSDNEIQRSLKSSSKKTALTALRSARSRLHLASSKLDETIRFLRGA